MSWACRGTLSGQGLRQLPGTATDIDDVQPLQRGNLPDGGDIVAR